MESRIDDFEQGKLLDSLVFNGVKQLPGEDMKATTTNIITQKMGATGFTEGFQSLLMTVRSLSEIFQEDSFHFKQTWNMANSLKRKSKKQYYPALFEENKVDPKITWKVTHELVSGPRRTQDPRIEIEVVAVEDRQELCDKFGDCFTNIGMKIRAEARSSQALLNGISFAGKIIMGAET
ncbi:hypothetical protein QYM36_013374 [Artemia franciscana]|uniref:Uncharacterized protein n=1 Tax=Artemia franciscana TaxID=6661 RepID=A0AA88HE36_ARTSF|nr:hypothetical protein QYM36_013374 [Artemia franciscana]